jgi:hypothetical protein
VVGSAVVGCALGRALGELLGTADGAVVGAAEGAGPVRTQTRSAKSVMPPLMDPSAR